MTSFTNLFFGHRHTPQRENVIRGRSLKVLEDEDYISRSLDVDDNKMENISISIKDITFVTDKSSARNIV